MAHQLEMNKEDFDEMLYQIASQHIYHLPERGDLKSRLNDDEDFIDEVSVWGIEEALKAAFWMGYDYGLEAQ